MLIRNDNSTFTLFSNPYIVSLPRETSWASASIFRFGRNLDVVANRGCKLIWEHYALSSRVSRCCFFCLLEKAGGKNRGKLGKKKRKRKKKKNQFNTRKRIVFLLNVLNQFPLFLRSRRIFLFTFCTPLNFFSFFLFFFKPIDIPSVKERERWRGRLWANKNSSLPWKGS